MRVGAVLLAAVLAGLGASSALACSLPAFAYVAEPPGLSPQESRRFQEEAEANWRRQWVVSDQYQLWNRADLVFLARIEEVVPSTITSRNGSEFEVIEVSDVVLRPVRWLKGDGEATPFQIGPKRWTSCGPAPSWAAMAGVPGDVHVVYVAGGSPGQETVLGIIPVADIVESEVKSRLPPPQ